MIGLLSRFAAGLAALGAMAAHPAQADTKAAFSCWDVSYSYTYTGVRSEADGYRFGISSANERIFSPLLPEHKLKWGRVNIQAVFPKDACVVDAKRSLFRCSARNVAVETRIGLGAPKDVTKTSETWPAMTVEFMRVGRAVVDPHVKDPRLLLLRRGTGAAQKTVVVLYGYGSDCSGHRSPFERR